MADVTFNAKSSAPDEQAGTGTHSHTNLTIAAGTDIGLLMEVVFSGDPGTVSSPVWGAQAMTLIDSNVNGKYAYLYGLLNPTTGNQTMAITVTNSVSVIMHGVAFNNVKQTSVATSFIDVTKATGTGTGGADPDITIPTAAGDATVDLVTVAGTSPNQTSLFSLSGGGPVDGASSYNISAGSSTRHAWTTADAWAAVGVHVVSTNTGGGGGATGGLSFTGSGLRPNAFAPGSAGWS